MESYCCCGRSAQALIMGGQMGPIFRIVANDEMSVGSIEIFYFITLNILLLLFGLLVIFV